MAQRIRVLDLLGPRGEAAPGLLALEARGRTTAPVVATLVPTTVIPTLVATTVVATLSAIAVIPTLVATTVVASLSAIAVIPTLVATTIIPSLSAIAVIPTLVATTIIPSLSAIAVIPTLVPTTVIPTLPGARPTVFAAVPTHALGALAGRGVLAVAPAVLAAGGLGGGLTAVVGLLRRLGGRLLLRGSVLLRGGPAGLLLRGHG